MQTQGGSLTKEQNQFILEACDKMGNIDPQVLRNGLLKMAYSDHREAFFNLKIPCFHIFGAKDRLVKQEIASKSWSLNITCVLFCKFSSYAIPN